MAEIISAPIFILISGLAQILIVIFAAIIFAYGVIIARNISEMTKIVKKEVDSIASDLEGARDDIKNGVELTKKRIGMLVGALSVQRALSLVMNGVSRVKKEKARIKKRQTKKKNPTV